jgi:hypothetical protein
MFNRDSDIITTKSGRKIHKLPMIPSTFVDRSIVIYGPSRTGKTLITKHIMEVVNGYIEQVLVVSPSEPTNKSFEGFVDPPFIHYRVYMGDTTKDEGNKGGLRFLESVWKRQEMMSSIYIRANNLDALSSLYSRLPEKVKKKGIEYIKLMNNKRKIAITKAKSQYHDDRDKFDEKTKDINEKFKKMTALIYKKHIITYYNRLWKCTNLSENERYSLLYLQFNPKLLLIFDDCAAQLKPFFSKEIFRMLFYQNRHSNITVIITCQDDTDLPANLRKNAFISFFTEPIVCESNFTRESNKYPKQIRQIANEVSSEVFKENKKVAYIREDDRKINFYYTNVTRSKPFKFGSSASHELCKIIQNDGVTMDKENPYYDKFKI